jgi:hypothetical protein
LNSDVYWITCEMDVTCDWLCWITTILAGILVGLKSSWFYWTTGVVWAQVREFDHFGDCFCTCALIIWTVLLHTWGMLSPKLDVDIVLLDEVDRQWRCSSSVRVFMLMTVETTLLQGTDCPSVCLILWILWSWNRQQSLWNCLSVSDKPLSLDHLEPLNIWVSFFNRIFLFLYF